MRKLFYGTRLIVMLLMTIITIPFVFIFCLIVASRYDEFKIMMAEPYDEVRRTYVQWKK